MKSSAGILLYRKREGRLQVLLAHPGGPFWAKKDLGAWTIPKGEFEPNEDPMDAARREFHEETGASLEGHQLTDIGEIRQLGGKVVRAWAAEGDFDPATLESNLFTLEWPPRSGRSQQFPEVDRAAWFDLDEANERILAAQAPFLQRVQELVG
jgi:predicted NUDIX family NTP pyrophosphohydrolase